MPPISSRNPAQLLATEPHVTSTAFRGSLLLPLSLSETRSANGNAVTQATTAGLSSVLGEQHSPRSPDSPQLQSTGPPVPRVLPPAVSKPRALSAGGVASPARASTSPGPRGQSRLAGDHPIPPRISSKETKRDETRRGEGALLGSPQEAEGRALLQRNPLPGIEHHALVKEVGEVCHRLPLVLPAAAHQLRLDGLRRRSNRHQAHGRLP